MDEGLYLMSPYNYVFFFSFLFFLPRYMTSK